MLHKCNIDLEISDYDKRSVGHLAAAEARYEVLEYLAKETNFNFDLSDRWGTKVLDECKSNELRKQIEKILESKKEKSHS